MNSARIPWHIFLDALADQRRSKLESWLVRWSFGNEGVYIANRKNSVSRESGSRNDSISVRQPLMLVKTEG
ncbi:MAG: hypothetical protein EXR70_08130 [Deltaproteobacteria bacterium]|nr:hypothetical protein [Deltaproteobacteria bacterium]